jgi:hypothetical protein
MITNPSRWLDRHHRLLQTSRVWSGAALPLAALVAAGLVTIGFSGGPGPASGGIVHASVKALLDSDFDGLTDAQERVLRTSPFDVDTDRDGFSDLEEFARHSDPTSARSTPLPADLGIGMSARGEGGENRIVIATYFANGIASGKSVSLGIAFAGRMIALDPADYQSGSTRQELPAAASGATVVIVDIPFDTSPVHTYGSLSVFASLSENRSSTVLAADAIDLVSTDGIPCLVEDPSERARALPFLGGWASHGSLYTPIPPTGEDTIPDTWTQEQICYQTSVVIGGYGGIIIHEIIDGKCIDEWDAYCRSDCESSAGSTFETFDPLGLIGG